MYFKQVIGKWGENLACQYLETNHYHIVAKNFFCRQGEIDIVAKDIVKNELVFVEVKTRSNLKYGIPSEAVNGFKQKHIKQVVNYYIHQNHLENVPIRVDVIEVFIEKQNSKIRHIKQIF